MREVPEWCIELYNQIKSSTLQFDSLKIVDEHVEISFSRLSYRLNLSVFRIPEHGFSLKCTFKGCLFSESVFTRLNKSLVSSLHQCYHDTDNPVTLECHKLTDPPSLELISEIVEYFFALASAIETHETQLVSSIKSFTPSFLKRTAPR